jgi:pyrroloquinoline quinone biosynthesis protein B
MKCLILGAAAGGGFPQWNCACRACARARSGDPAARPRTQVSVAATADDIHWLIIGASPDLRQQILQTPALFPQTGARHSPITGVVLLSADVDGIAGLLVLREQQALRIFAPAPILKILAQNQIFAALDSRLVERIDLPPNTPVEAAPGLMLTLLPMPGKIPLYQENRSSLVAEPGATYAARLEAAGRCAIIAPACADYSSIVQQSLAPADVLLFDGTLFTDDEMITEGVGQKTGRRMGHMPVSGEDGSLVKLAEHSGRCIYVHINNTNPMLLDDSPQRAEVHAAGVEVAYDGMEIVV